VYFRIVHTPLPSNNASPAPSYRDQTVEITLHHNDSIEKGKIGALTRRMSVDQVTSAVSPQRREAKLPKEPCMPRVVELLRKAIEWQALLKSGECTSQSEIATREQLTRGRVTQIMGMLNLVPEIRENILSMPKAVGRSSVTERVLRPITALTDPCDQLREFHKLLPHSAISLRPRPTAGPVVTKTSGNSYR